MKKLIILFSLLPIISFGQMTITSPNITFSDGRTFPCKQYMAKIPTNNWILWLHGSGETGPLDGSQVNKLELYLDPPTNKIPVTWTAQARNGFEFPFNILAVQLPPGFDFWAIQSTGAVYLKEVLKADKIGVTGYSLGGRGCWYLLYNDSKQYINFIAPVCGFYDFSQGDISKVRSLPGYGVHGSNDTTMPYAYDLQTFQLYNSVSSNRPTQVISGIQQPCYFLNTISGAGHNVWQLSYDVAQGKDFLLQWVIQQFGPTTVVNDPVINTVFDGANIIETTKSGKTLTIKPISIN